MGRHGLGAAAAACLALWIAALSKPAGQAGAPAGTAAPPSIPEFWSAELLEDYELPLATASRTPTHVSRDYYYALPERRVFKSYPVYHPDREPAGYMDGLRAAEPEIVFDPTTLRTEADWIAAGRLVFEMPIDVNGPILRPSQVRDRAWYDRYRVPVARDGTMPFARWVVRAKGRVELGNIACAMCHTRVLPDGTAIAGAQGNFPFDQIFADDIPNIPEAVMPLVVRDSSERRGTSPAPSGCDGCRAPSCARPGRRFHPASSRVRARASLRRRRCPTSSASPTARISTRPGWAAIAASPT